MTEQKNPELEETNTEQLFEHFRFVADPKLKLLRVDKFLLDRMPNTTRNRIQRACKEGNVFVNEISVKANYKVKPRDVVTMELPFPMRENKLIPEDLPVDIVYEDDDLLVVNKAPNMLVHPGLGNYTGTLVNGLIYHFENLPDRGDNIYSRPGLVHRLDKHTTGLLVVAKTEQALTHLAKQFFDRTTERRYHALVWGDVKEDVGTITGHIGRSLKNRKMFTVFPEGDNGKHAVTHYKVLKRYGYVTLVECKLETGRTHQIRVHMKYIGHPLFYDLEYGGDSILKGTTSSKYKKFIENCFKLLQGQALHAKTLGFQHPSKDEYLRLNSELSEGFSKVIEKWEKYTYVD